MSRFMSSEEHLQIMALHEKGVPQKEIAAQMGRACSSICYIIKHGHERSLGHKNKVKRHYEYQPIETVDLASLPDDVLFKHSREYSF